MSRACLGKMDVLYQKWGKGRVLTWIVSTIVSETIWQRSPAEHAASFSSFQVLSRACLGKSSPITQLGVHKSGSQKLQHVLAPSSSSESLLKVQPATPETTVWIRPPDGCPEPVLAKKVVFCTEISRTKRERAFFTAFRALCRLLCRGRAVRRLDNLV
jgi:hypothetical protein